MNELQVYEAQQIQVASARTGYAVTTPQGEAKLKRDVDFGVIPGTKKPSLFKAGAEKIANAMGMLQHYTIVSSIEDAERPLFFYTVKCELCKISNDGKEYVFYTAYGSANTMEKRNGRNGAFDSANATLKMAQKRSLVSAVISMGCLSDLFTQDMENEYFVNGGMKDVQSTMKDTDPITNKQGKRLIALAGEAGYNFAAMKKVLADAGFPDMKAITQAEYDKACALFLNAEG